MAKESAKAKRKAAGKPAKPAAKSKPAAGAKAGAKAAAAEGAEDDDDASRRLGLRGAAPWAARHAARRAAEARARAAEPPRPGSARATLRTPDQADQIKARVAELHNTLGRVRLLRKHLNDTFFEIAVLLKRINDQKLYEAKGYSSFESFAERELDLGKSTCVRLVRVPTVFQESAAKTYGMEGLLAALGALEDPRGAGTQPTPSSPVGSPLPLKPPTSR